MMRRSSPAFTIVELLVVIVVIGILAIISLISYGGVTNRANVTSIFSDLNNASIQLKMFNVENNTYPTSVVDCPAPAAGNLCLRPSSGTSYQYKPAVNNRAFCLTASKTNASYNLTQDGQILEGSCSISQLDAGNIVSYPGSGTTLYDLSGNSHNGVLVNGVTYSTSGGGSLSFDGVDDYIDMDITSITAPSGSISLWYYAKPWYNYQTIYDNVSNPDDWEMWIYSDGILRSRIESDLYVSYDLDNLSGPNNWYAITITWSAAPLETKMYVNGILRDTDSSGTWINPGNHFYYGGGNAGNTKGNGIISNIKLGNYVPAASEILQNYNATKGRYGL